MIDCKYCAIKKKGGPVVINVKLYRHPNLKKGGTYYLIPRNYLDELSSFDGKVYLDWCFDRNDKRKVKRIKKNKYKR